MNKKVKILTGLTFACVFSIALTSCAAFNNISSVPRVALVTDCADIDDRSFNQGTWEGLEDYLIPKGYRINKDFKFFVPLTISAADYLSSIDDAIIWGAKAVIVCGFRYEPIIHKAQYKYPDVKFLIEDGVPRPSDDLSKEDVADNTIGLYFKEHESGFFAGYSSVYDGYKNLGFMGGMSVPAVKKFGAGFLAGAYFAGSELGIKDIRIPDHNYEYLNSWAPNADVKAKAASWYLGGTDIIFSAAGGAGASVMTAAEESKNWMIGVDVDQAYMSKSVLTSAKKNLSKAVEIFLDRVFNNWIGGEVLNLGTESDGVSLPLEVSNGVDPWRFSKFSKQQYFDIYERVKQGEVIVPHDYQTLNKFANDLGYKLEVSEKNFNDQN